MIPTLLCRDTYSGVVNEEILDSITAERTRVCSVFNDREKRREITSADTALFRSRSGIIIRISENTGHR